MYVIVFIALYACSLQAQVEVERNFNLELAEKDSITSMNIEKVLNGFLAEAQEKKYTEKYVDSTHLIKYEFFFNKLSGIGKQDYFDRPLVLKSYRVEDNAFRLTIGFTGERDGKPFIFQMTELKAVPFNGSYRFYCPFEDNTRHFKSKKIDKVTYHYSQSFNEDRAKEFVDFTQEFARLTNGPIPEIDYHSFHSLDELLKSYGFLYSARQCNFLHHDLGFMDNDGKAYVTGMNNENYVSDYIAEYIYRYLPNSDDVYWPFALGVSAYYGGYFTTYDDMETMKRQFREKVKESPTIDFLEEFKKGRKSSVSRHFSYYVISAFLFEKVLKEKGFDEAFELVYSGGKGERLFEKLEKSVQVSEENFHDTILELIKEEKPSNRGIGATKVSSDTLSFYISDNSNIIFKAVINETDTMEWFFDTGATDLVMLNSAISEHGYKPSEETYTFSLGNMKWENQTIYPFPVGPKEAVGHFGWNFFEGKIVELDYDKKRMIVHSTHLPDTDGYVKLEMEFVKTLFCIKSTAHVANQEFPNRYLFDTGFQRAIVMDKELRKKSQFPTNLPVIKESRLKNSAGKVFVNQVVELDKLCFGASCAHKVPVQLLSTPNPATFETHILGGELLKRYNTILDFQSGIVYMKPNSLMSLPYKDTMK